MNLCLINLSLTNVKDHPNNVDMVLKQANQLYGRVDRYSIKQSLKLQDNKAVRHCATSKVFNL